MSAPRKPDPDPHSPLPWGFGKSSRQIFSKATGAHVATLHAAPLLFPAEKAAPTIEQAEANAAFIVRACNEYETLKQQLADAIPADVYLTIKKQRDEEYSKLESDRDAEAIRAEGNEAHAQRLADALGNFAGFSMTQATVDFGAIGAMSQFVALKWKARAALAQWEQDNQ